MMQTLKIGDVSLKNNLILAPMAGVTDLPFRLLCKEQGAGLLCMEMVSAKAIYFNNKNTEELQIRKYLSSAAVCPEPDRSSLITFRNIM